MSKIVRISSLDVEYQAVCYAQHICLKLRHIYDRETKTTVTSTIDGL